MKYCDLHCDALTNEGVLQVTKQSLTQGGCRLQCFAAFISAREDRFAQAIALADAFGALCSENGYHPVRRTGELGDGINALLTVEDGGAIEGDLQKLETLYSRGVRMMTLTWNYPNEIGFPAFPDYDALCSGSLSLRVREKERGLTRFGFSCLEKMKELGMIADVSHGSDRLVSDAAKIGNPFVASHSGARSVYDCARNLTDEGIRAVAESGGVIGLDFCADFLSDDKSAEGQRAALIAHARAILNAGGEDSLAIGSDFDGIPENPYLKNPADVPRLLEAFGKIFGARVTEKIACGNFMRVFSAVCG